MRCPATSLAAIQMSCSSQHTRSAADYRDEVDGVEDVGWSFPWPRDEIADYTAFKVADAPIIDGRLDEPAWHRAPKSPRFRDLISGLQTRYDTRAAVMWDDQLLYVGYWVEEPDVTATLRERDSPVYTDNDIELFVAGSDAYYELEVNAFGTIYEALFVWNDAYPEGGHYGGDPGLSLGVPGSRPFDGVGFAHPRGGRRGFFGWDLPGLSTAVVVDGTLNDLSDADRGWTVELALPWTGLAPIAHGDGRSLPPRSGDTWRMGFSRFNTSRADQPSDDSGGWSWSPHGVWDSHIPELFVTVEFSTDHL
jgi:hypothetical protein